MKIGQFEVLVLCVNDAGTETVLSEKVVDGTLFAVAEPGKEYFVKVNVHRDLEGNFTFKYVRIGLFVDGYDVQYWKRLDMSDQSTIPSDQPSHTKFWGFKENTADLK